MKQEGYDLITCDNCKKQEFIRKVGTDNPEGTWFMFVTQTNPVFTEIEGNKIRKISVTVQNVKDFCCLNCLKEYIEKIQEEAIIAKKQHEELTEQLKKDTEEFNKMPPIREAEAKALTSLQAAAIISENQNLPKGTPVKVPESMVSEISS